MQSSWKENNTYLKESSPKKKIEYMVRIDEPGAEPRDIYFYTFAKAKEYKNTYLDGLLTSKWLKQAKLQKFSSSPNYAEKLWQDLLANGVKIYRVITNFVEVEDEDDLPSLFTDEK